MYVLPEYISYTAQMASVTSMELNPWHLSILILHFQQDDFCIIEEQDLSSYINPCFEMATKFFVENRHRRKPVVEKTFGESNFLPKNFSMKKFVPQRRFYFLGFRRRIFSTKKVFDETFRCRSKLGHCWNSRLAYYAVLILTGILR